MNRKKVFWTIFGFVAFVHLAGIGLTTLGPARPNFTPVKKQHVVVKTIALNPSPPPQKISPPEPTKTLAAAAPAIASTPAPPAKPAPVKVAPSPLPAPKPVIKPAPVTKPASVAKPTSVAKAAPPAAPPKKPTPAATPIAKETPPVNTISAEKKALLAKAQASLAKVGSAPLPKNTPSTTTFQDLTIQMGDIALGDSNTIDSLDYPSLIVGRIQSSLTLPEHGKVELTLKLHKSGKVLKVTINHSASQKNKTYVENQLSKLQFPAFIGINDEEINLDLTLINAK